MSEWLESLRRDVECLFGVLKSRFRNWRNPVIFHTIDDIQNIMFCCCILHNLILGADGIDAAWEDDVAWDTLEPVAELDDCDECIVEGPMAINHATPLLNDLLVICQISSVCMRN